MAYVGWRGGGSCHNARKTLSALPAARHGKVQHYHTGLLREIAFYIQEEPLG